MTFILKTNLNFWVDYKPSQFGKRESFLFLWFLGWLISPKVKSLSDWISTSDPVFPPYSTIDRSRDLAVAPLLTFASFAFLICLLDNNTLKGCKVSWGLQTSIKMHFVCHSFPLDFISVTVWELDWVMTTIFFGLLCKTLWKYLFLLQSVSSLTSIASRTSLKFYHNMLSLINVVFSDPSFLPIFAIHRRFNLTDSGKTLKALKYVLNFQLNFLI